MITNFITDAQNRLLPSTLSLKESLWVELYQPTQKERDLIEEAFQLELPEHHEMHQLEFSNRFYQEGENYFLSLNITVKALPIPENHVVTFIITPKQLITLRYSDPNPIKTFIDQLETRPQYVKDHLDLLETLLEVCIGRVADIFELIEEKAEEINFALTKTIDQTVSVKRSLILSNSLKDISRLENLLSKGLQSLSSLNLFLVYLKQINHGLFSKAAQQLKMLDQDINALLDNGDYLSQKLNFLLQSSLGLINIEQTHIIKTFTVLAMIFMPPTLIASIYGMNFKFMPELNWYLGYPLAILTMIFSAYIPYRYFRKKKWI